ncbi:MAG: fumarylacetoacetate hydrolase family protein [Woronichinia naegeliana WA131]|jgi:2-keto-4-pentenoate hydratase/2-oxohepta-3-ene-1,7-dioic acid hydratase in catechol pathway|uniref:Fumarylacetoacetate hydrolase family protein n=1 Tax=Woronichinia naegeliana WA131 TaxID=2824559 RepID=A0A977L469_9CYAN|nr:MAG: fumarylacetoacetate hydrolase family protein [Woronichinia naegeliana WA131]
MAQRYVRIQSQDQQLYYGLLQPNRSVEVLDQAPWLGGKSTGLVLAESDYRLLSPCTPSKIIAVGRNYPAHAAELGNSVPPEPLLFLKPPTAIAAHGQTVFYPAQSQRVDYEGELALVIGATTKDCSVEAASSIIWGYTIANDITARDLQRQDSQWTRAKGFDGFCPLGPWIIRDLTIDARLQTFVNEETVPRQSAKINEMVFSPAVLVSYISQIMTLLPGDIILTGTPEGIGPLQVGDTVRIEIEGIGSLETAIAVKQKT